MTSNKRILPEFVISIIIIAVSIFAIIIATGYKDPMEGEYPTLRSTFIPILWASFLGGLGFIYFITLLVRKRRNEPQELRLPKSEFISEEKSEEKVQMPNKQKLLFATILTGVVLFIYCFFLKKFHFALLTVGFIFALLTLYEGINKWLINLVISLIGGIVIYIIFVIFMQIPL